MASNLKNKTQIANTESDVDLNLDGDPIYKTYLNEFVEDILTNTKGRSMRMCSGSVGEDVWCTEIKTHEVELILGKKSVLDFTDENK